MADIGNLLDETLQAQALTFLGAYDTHAVQTVLIDSAYDYDRIKNSQDLPAAIIVSNEGKTAPGAHDGTGINLELTHQYSIVLVAKVTGKRNAQIAAKVFRRRLITFITRNVTQAALYALVGDDDERVIDIHYGQFAGQPVLGRSDKDEGDYIVWAAFSFDIVTG